MKEGKAAMSVWSKHVHEGGGGSTAMCSITSKVYESKVGDKGVFEEWEVERAIRWRIKSAE